MKTERIRFLWILLRFETESRLDTTGKTIMMGLLRRTQSNVARDVEDFPDCSCPAATCCLRTLSPDG